MLPRARPALPLAILCLLVSAATTHADRPAPTRLTPPNTTLQPPAAGTSPVATGCRLGIQGPAAKVFGYILPPNDVYYTLLDPQQCSACHPHGLLLSTAHMMVYFTESCEIPVTVSIMPAEDPDGDGCYTPNPLAQPLCAPVTYMINDGGVLNTCQEVELPIAAACCVDRPVFLAIEFDPGSCSAGRPAFCGPASCQNCRQYNFYPGASFPGDDLCVVLSPAELFGIIMFAEAQCCSPTPTLPGSWGKVKSLYR